MRTERTAGHLLRLPVHLPSGVREGFHLRDIVLALMMVAAAGGLPGCNGSNGDDEMQPGAQQNTAVAGTFTSADGNAKVTIPDGALNQASQISVTVAANAPAGNIGAAYEFRPVSATFSRPVTIEIGYAQNALPAGVRDADLTLSRVVNNQWVPIARSGVMGTTAGTVTGTATSFGVFGLVPVTPSGLDAVPADSQVTLTWTGVDLATSYNVYWSTSTDNDRITDVSSPFVHAVLSNGTSYTYRVSAQKPIGEGGLSAPVSATPMAMGVVPGQPQNVVGCPADQEVTLVWDPVADATFYNLAWDGTVNGTKDGGNVINDITETMFTHLGRDNGATYEYFLAAGNAVDIGPDSTPAVVVLSTLDPPGGFMAVGGVERVTLSWNRVRCADGYRIDWEGGGLSDSIDIPDPATVDFIHTGLENGTTYTYTIVTLNAFGAGAPSAAVSATPQAVPMPVQVSTGRAPDTCVVYTNGSLRCLGNNPGDGTQYSADVVTVPGIGNASHVSVGSASTCVVDGGAVRCWGANGSGQLGDGTTTPSLTPVTVSGITTASFVATGDSHACAIIDAGTVQCWGSGLGIGTFDPATDTSTPSSTPVTVNLPAAATRLSAGKLRELTCAVLATNETWCWGNARSEYELDPSACSFNLCAPALATGLGPTDTFAEVGRSHACYLPVAAGGEVRCRGAAKGDTFDTLDPAFAFDVIAAGEEFNCGIVPGGEARCWGWNGEFQLGNGTNTVERFSTAIAVTGVANASAIAAGFTHGCAIDDGMVKCWGGGILGGPAPFVVPGL